MVGQLNISRADIPCILENDVGEAARSTQLVTLYISVHIIPPNLYNNPQIIPTKVDNFPVEEATIPGRSQSPSHHQPVESTTLPQSWEEMSPTSTKNPRLALHWADKVMKRIVPTDRSNKWETAVGRIKWVMDTLGPIAEVRVFPFVGLG